MSPAPENANALFAPGEPSIHFEWINDIPVFRPVATLSLKDAVQLVTSVLKAARAQGFAKLLMSLQGLDGFASPSTADRFFMVHEWAAVAAGHIRVAMVLRPEYIDPERFGITVATNLGLDADVFVSEQEALAWL
jgi:hypothetical protein